ncbi:tyrosine-protein phosphatase [Kitasatospora sp. NPDC049258]|uniref:tyrosine-protein phosphatase n=1 Tax=Kitasatospora sp. NPDC049258 TaxID=3155394 RepID=UPI00342B6BA7
MATIPGRPAAAAALATALTAGAATLAGPAAAAPLAGQDRHTRIPFTAATATQQADGSFTLTWTAPGVRGVTVYAGTDRDRIRHRTPVARGNGSTTVTVKGLAAADRWYFDLVPDRGGQLTAAPDRIPAGATVVAANVLGAADTGAFNVTRPQAAVQAMVEAERTMVSADSARSAYRSVLDAVGEGHGAVLFHCTAGKDRTGWAGATLLTALGVPRATVEADYLASNTYRAEADAAVLAKLPPAYQALYKPLLDVRPEYLNAGFDEVAAGFGGFDRYLDKGLRQDRHDLRDLRRDLLVG